MDHMSRRQKKNTPGEKITVPKAASSKSFKISLSLLFCENLLFPFLVACLVFVKRMLMGSNEFIFRPESFFQQKVLARLSFFLFLFQHLDDQERKRQKSVGKLKKQKEKGRKEQEKNMKEERTN